MKPDFAKASLELMNVAGFPARLQLLYARLCLYAGKDGKCHPKHATVASEIGVKPRQIRNLLWQLRILRLVEWRRGRYSNAYRVLNPDRQWIANVIGNGLPVSDRQWNAYRKESSSKETLKRSPSPTPPLPGAGSRGRRARKAAVSHPASAETQNAGSPNQFDDDEKPKLRKRSPEAEFRERLKDRHGSSFDADRCLQHVTRELEKCHGLTLTDFISYDVERTTAPAAIHNPMGFYTNLARELRREAIAAPHRYADGLLRKAAAGAPPEPERDQRGLCVKCGGPGVLTDGKFCACPMGRDLERVERRKAQSLDGGTKKAEGERL